MSTQLGGKVNQIHGLWNKVIVPIPRPKMVYITPIMMTQTNRYMGWPPSILINYEGHKIGSMVNPKMGGLVAKPHWSIFKYPYYKKDAYLDSHVRIFHAIVIANGETYEKYIINAFNYTLRKMTLYWCHNYMLDRLDVLKAKKGWNANWIWRKWQSVP